MKYNQKGGSELMIFASRPHLAKTENELKTLKNNKNINKMIRHKVSTNISSEKCIDDLRILHSIGIPWWSGVRTPLLLLLRAQVQSPAQELRSRKP